MRTDLYHAETKRIAAQQGALLDEPTLACLHHGLSRPSNKMACCMGSKC